MTQYMWTCCRAKGIGIAHVQFMKEHTILLTARQALALMRVLSIHAISRCCCMVKTIRISTPLSLRACLVVGYDLMTACGPHCGMCPPWVTSGCEIHIWDAHWTARIANTFPQVAHSSVPHRCQVSVCVGKSDSPQPHLAAWKWSHEIYTTYSLFSHTISKTNCGLINKNNINLHRSDACRFAAIVFHRRALYCAEYHIRNFLYRPEK